MSVYDICKRDTVCLTIAYLMISCGPQLPDSFDYATDVAAAAPVDAVTDENAGNVVGAAAADVDAGVC